MKRELLPNMLPRLLTAEKSSCPKLSQILSLNNACTVRASFEARSDCLGKSPEADVLRRATFLRNRRWAPAIGDSPRWAAGRRGPHGSQWGNETLRADTYKSKLVMKELRAKHKLDLKPYAVFGQNELEARHRLLYEITKIIWQ